LIFGGHLLKVLTLVECICCHGLVEVNCFLYLFARLQLQRRLLLSFVDTRRDHDTRLDRLNLLSQLSDKFGVSTCVCCVDKFFFMVAINALPLN
jgi:hypothetical protein